MLHKFRAWDRDHNEMLNWEELCMHDVGYAMSEESWCDVMQYTGLKDKNGKEIYEGDIIQMSSGPDEELHTFEVYWCDSELMWDVKNIDLPDNNCWAINENYNLKVIGNIYENPELRDV